MAPHSTPLGRFRAHSATAEPVTELVSFARCTVWRGHYDGVGEWGERSGVRVNGFRVDVSQLCSLFSFVRVRWRPGFSPEELRHQIWAVDLAHVINKVPLVFELER